MRLPASLMKRVSRLLTLMDRDTSERVPWEPRPEQDRVWELMEAHKHLLISKPRRTGMSVACTLPEVVGALAADERGDTVLHVCAIDTDDKAGHQARVAVDFAQQLEGRIRPNDHGFTLPASGSEVVYITAGGKMAGRGTSIHHLRCTELPFWRDPRNSFQSLRSAAHSASIIIETTMDVDKQGFARGMWRGQRRDEETGAQIAVGPEFHRHFFSVEDQGSYRLDPDLITAEEWAHASGRHGFTDRGAAAWWLAHALPNLCQGDWSRLMHDYPQSEWHLFAATTGRVITVTPRVAPVVDRIPVPGMGGKVWGVDVYVPPARCSGNVLVSVDTAYGVNKTRSVVLVTDVSDGRILAGFASPLIVYDDLARVAQMAWHTYREGMPKVPLVHGRCDVIIEINGIGHSTAHEAGKIGLPFIAMDQLKNYHVHGADACVKAVKRKIEVVGPDGLSLVAGPPELAEECDSLTKQGGKLEGLKDVIMTYGMALVRRIELGIIDERWKAPRKDPNKIYIEDRMKEQRQARRRR